MSEYLFTMDCVEDSRITLARNITNQQIVPRIGEHVMFEGGGCEVFSVFHDIETARVEVHGERIDIKRMANLLLGNPEQWWIKGRKYFKPYEPLFRQHFSQNGGDRNQQINFTEKLESLL